MHHHIARALGPCVANAWADRGFSDDRFPEGSAYLNPAKPEVVSQQSTVNSQGLGQFLITGDNLLPRYTLSEFMP